MPRQPLSEEKLSQLEQDDLGVQEFLDAFAVAMTSGDTDTIAELWETPAYLVGDQIARTVEDAEDIHTLFKDAKANYNKIGIVATNAEIVRLDEITDRIVSVRVRWPYLDAAGVEVGAEASTYTLRRNADGEWRLRVALMHGQEALH
jgi:ketosteroid isomerase-like protein